MPILPRVPPRNWLAQGKRPDYRFSFANERTFLAWIRTTLAFLATGIGIEQFSGDFYYFGFKYVTVFILLGAAIVASLFAYTRWSSAEYAMRQDADLQQDSIGLILAVAATAVTCVTLTCWLFVKIL